MKPHLTVGIIGHVDHGKTSLVKALTGIDTDRLKEEKERGMSIVLGFAYLESEQGVIDLVDVPGHENFVRTMVAGATGIDSALLVIDINEGVKPQTAEHLAITQLTGIRHGIVVFTKCDRADQGRRIAAVGALRGLLKGTYLESAPVVFTSSITGEGLDELKAELESCLARQTAVQAPSTQFYLPIDRSFSAAGRGTVVTGTLRKGRLEVGDEVDLMPTGLRTTVRQLEFHGRPVQCALPGQRVGVNLRHLKAEQAGRGHTLCSPGLLHAGVLLDVQLRLRADQERTLQDGQTVRLLFGTADVAARVRLLTGAPLEPGQCGMAQLRTMLPVAAALGDAFILRQETPPMTIGGGRILDPLAKRIRRGDHDAMARLQVLARGDQAEVLRELLKSAGYSGTSVVALAAAAGMPATQVQAMLNADFAVATDDQHVLYKPFLDVLGDMMVAALVKFHAKHPASRGAPLSHCRGWLPRSVSESVFRLALRTLSAGKRIEVDAGMARRYGYDPFSVLSEHDKKLALAIESRVKLGGLAPPDIDELLNGEEEREALLHLLVERGNLVLIPGERADRRLVFHRDAMQDAVRRMQDAFPPPSQFTVSEIRSIFASTRKFIVPLLQYFDTAGYTRRYGDKRTAVGGAGKRR